MRSSELRNGHKSAVGAAKGTPLDMVMETSMRAVVTLTVVAIVGLGCMPASAQKGDDCREVVRATARVPGTSVIAKVRGREKAIGRWRERVTARYGAAFRTWLKAHD
jgi:hypothetical protein